MKPSCLIIIGLLISLHLFSQLTVQKVSSELAIDGLLEESFWDISNQITNGNSNNTANFGILWDDDYLYVGVDVADGILCNNKRQGFFDDGIEICIDGNNDKGISFDQYDRILVKPIRSYWIQEMERRYDGIIHNFMENASGYTMEFAIPWSNFAVTPAAGMDFGFNIVVNDDEDSNNQHNIPTQLIWTGSSNYYQNPSTWGSISLSGQTISYSGDYLALISPNGEDFCINDKTTLINWICNGISNIDIEYSTNNGGNWTSIATSISANSNSYSWNISSTASEQCLIRISETGNQSLNDVSENVFTISAQLTAVEPLIPNIWKNYEWPYNAYFPEDANGINGHVGSACGHASLARTIHYWEFPIVGNDVLNFIDNSGFTWSANFGATTYNYDNMPYYLSPESTEAAYTDVAKLTYHAATSMNDYYGSGGDLNNMSYAMSHYFNYKVSTPAISTDYTLAEWTSLLMSELDNGRVLLIDGMTTEILGDWHENNWIAGHWFHIDGYNEDGQFHGVLGYGDEDRWFDIESVFDYYLNNGVLIGLEPDLNGKELSLQTQNGGEVFQSGESIPINWNSTGILNIRIESTIDNGQNWIEIINSMPASSGTYDWIVPNTTSGECKIKVRDADDINVYDKSNSPFSILAYDVELIHPNGGEFGISGETLSITWGNTTVPNVKIEYSLNSGSVWEEIISSTPTSTGSYNWVVPEVSSNQCLIRISDASNATIFDLSEGIFQIGKSNTLGGPYVSDNNTVLLLHFDNNLNESSHDYNIGDTGASKTYISNPDVALNSAVYIDNSHSTNHSFITVPNSGNEMSLDGNWTIEFWFNIESWDQSHNNWPVPIALPTGGWDVNYSLEIPSSDGRLKYGFNSSNGGAAVYSSQNSIKTGTWYHVALINDYDNHTIKILLHDSSFNILEEQSASYTAGTTISMATQDLKIGAGIAGDNYFNGYIDELRISDVVRSFKNAEPETRILLRSNSKIEVWGLVSEDAAADTIIKVLTANYDRIADSLNVQLSQTIVVDVYPDLSTYHTAIGWPDAPDWVVGTAKGEDKIDLVSPFNPGPEHSFESIIDVISHELVHCFVHKLANGAVISTWLNEGTAAYLSYQVKTEDNICYYVDQNGGILPTLDVLNIGSTFGNIGGYTFSYTIVELITRYLGGSDILSQFIASGLDYSILGFENELAFQNDWHQYIYLNYRCTFKELHAVFSANITSGTNPLEVEFTDYSAEGDAAITQWNWDFENDGIIDSHEQNPDWTFNEPGTYSVSLMVSDGTNTSSYIKPEYIIVSNGGTYFDGNDTQNDLFSVYPNPAHLMVYISAPGTFDLSIYTITGQKIFEKESYNNEELDISGYAKGIYFLTLEGVEGSVTKKLIVK